MNAETLRAARDQEMRWGHTQAHRTVRLLIITCALAVLGIIALCFGAPGGFGGVVLEFLPAAWSVAALVMSLATATGALAFAILDLAALHRARIMEQVFDGLNNATLGRPGDP